MPNIMSNICSLRLIEAVNNDSIINKDIGRYAHQVGDQISGYEDRVGDQFARYGQQTAEFWSDLL